MDSVNEIAKKQREERRQIEKDADLFAQMMASEAWKRYIALIESVAQNYHAVIMKPLESVLEVTKTENAKGILSGLTLASALPGMKIKEAHELRPAPDEEDE
jgi:hypothetical protein